MASDEARERFEKWAQEIIAKTLESDRLAHLVLADYLQAAARDTRERCAEIEVKADSLFAAYCDSQADKGLIDGKIDWIAWQRVADFVNKFVAERIRQG